MATFLNSFLNSLGVSGFVSNLTLLAIHWALRDKLLDPTGETRADADGQLH